MSEFSEDTFKFDPTSYWKEIAHYEPVKLVPVANQETGDVVYICAKKLKTQSEQEILAEVDEYYYRYNLFKNSLDSEQIKQSAQWLRKHSNLLSLIASQLAFHLLKLYEHLLKIRLKTTGNFLDPKLPSFTIIVDKEGSLGSVKLNLNDKDVDKIIEHLEKKLAPKLEIDQIWEQGAKELIIYHAISATERMERDLGCEAFNNLSSESKVETFNQYLEGEKSGDLESETSIVVQEISQRTVPAIIQDLNLPNLTIARLDEILGFRQDNASEPVPVTESKLTDDTLPVPTGAAFASAITAQIRKDLWNKDSNGIAYFKHQAKGNPNNYIEHYISSPGDVRVLPWEQAEQIIDKFGFNTVKLHLIFAAHTMNQLVPWQGKFSLKASDVIKYLGWDRRTDLPTHQKLNEIAKVAFVLDCLLVKSVWIEGRNKKGQINASTPTGRMWNVVVDPRGQLNIDDKVEKPEEVYITVQPGLIFHSFLNKAGSKLKEALYQFGYLAQDILRIDPYHDELALRLAIHLAMDSRIHVTGKYRVETLLKALLPHTVIDLARTDKRKGYDLKQRWDNALKLLLNLKWQIQFDESYPKWLQPATNAKKPSEARRMKIIEWLLSAKITIKPPEPIPEMLAATVKPKLKVQKQITPRVAGLTSDQIRKARNAKGWSQRKLAGWLSVTQTLVGYWEKGKRTPSEEMETKLRQLLEIAD